MERLPAELVYPILRGAAMDAVCNDREWVVQLALVSRFVHELVSPILYHTMFVSRCNHLKIAALAAAAENNNAHIFRAVRFLVADDWLDLWDSGRWGLFSNVTAIDGSLHLIEMLSRNPKSCLRRLAVRYGCIFDLPDRLPTSTLAGVTHIAGYAPNTGYSLARVVERTEKLLNSMPALTHVALELISVSYRPPDDDSDFDSDSDVAQDVSHELASLERVLRGTLQRPRIRAVAVRVATPYLPHLPAILAVMTQLQDTRVSAWEDTRRIRSWDREERLLAADAMAGRTIWTEAQQVWWPDARGLPSRAS